MVINFHRLKFQILGKRWTPKKSHHCIAGNNKFGRWAQSPLQKILADLNWQFGMGLPYVQLIYYVQVRKFYFTVAKTDRQTTKFNSPPNFPAIQ